MKLFDNLPEAFVVGAILVLLLAGVVYRCESKVDNGPLHETPWD